MISDLALNLCKQNQHSHLHIMKKITLDVRPELHKRLRFLSVMLDRSIASLTSEAIENLVDHYSSVTGGGLVKVDDSGKFQFDSKDLE
jgi:hypothetical protein